MDQNVKHNSQLVQEKLTAVKKVDLMTPDGEPMTLVSDNGLFYIDGQKEDAILLNRGAFDQHVNNLIYIHGWMVMDVHYLNNEKEEKPWQKQRDM